MDPVKLSRKAEVIPEYRAYTPVQFRKSIYWNRLDGRQQRVFDVVTKVLPFKANEYVLRELVDWSNIPIDPMFQLLFPQPGMLSDEQFALIEAALDATDSAQLRLAVEQVRLQLNPHPAGQVTHNVPVLDGDAVEGIQHKYAETVLFFPKLGQTCHAYCSFCFRWPQFVGGATQRFQAKQSDQLVDYLREHPEVSDVLFTGGDPMVMTYADLLELIEPLLEIESVKTIRIGSKVLTYWPFRLTSDADAAELLDLFRKVVQSGRHLAFMAHFNHPRELQSQSVRDAIKAIQGTGAVIRTQGPLLRNINDNAQSWAELWNETVRLGCIPYYMFVERDTGASDYFAVPLVEALEIFRQAYMRVSGLGRTVRGPVMSALPGKVLVDGVIDIGSECFLQLQFLQARDAEAVRKPFLARYNAQATWFDHLELIGPATV